MSASKCKMFFSPTLWWSSKIAACVSAVWQGSSRSLELLSLPFQDVVSVFLLLSYFSMDKKTTLIQSLSEKPPSSLSPIIKWAFVTQEKFREGQWYQPWSHSKSKEIAPHWHLGSELWAWTAFPVWRSGITKDGQISLARHTDTCLSVVDYY